MSLSQCEIADDFVDELTEAAANLLDRAEEYAAKGDVANTLLYAARALRFEMATIRIAVDALRD